MDQIMSQKTSIDDYLKVVGDYADQVAAADQTANRDTMAVAEAMDAMYESREWVAEWLEQKPEPKRPTARWAPDDRNRFIAWQAWKLERAGRKPLSRPRAWTLAEAAVTRKICSVGTDLATVEPLRPLFWLRKNRYEDRGPEVWAIAVELAGGAPSKVTSAHTKEALAQWKRRMFPKSDGTPRKTPAAVSQAANAAGMANRLRQQMLEELAEMYRLACLNERAQDEFNGLLADFDAFLDAHAADAA